MSRNQPKRGVLGRSQAIPAPAAETERRAGVYPAELTFAVTSVHALAKISALSSEFQTEQVEEDYTEAYFTDYTEDEQLVSNNKSQVSPGKDTNSDTFQSHVNPAFQHDNESICGNNGGSSEKVAEFTEVDTATIISEKKHKKHSDTDSKVHSKMKQSRVRSQIPKATNKDQVKVLGDPNSDKLTPKLDKAVTTVTSTRIDDCQQDETKPVDSLTEDLHVQITVTSDAKDEIVEVNLEENIDNESELVLSGNSPGSSDTIPHECLDNIEVLVAVVEQLPANGDRPDRSHNRSLSSAPTCISNTMDGQSAEASAKNVQRSKSMRLSPASGSELPRVRKPLLRELSFSDCDSKKFRNYGSLRTASSLPKRRQLGLGDNESDSSTHIPKFLKPELADHLLNLMQQLLGRGKVRQVAVLEQRNGNMVVSLPTWKLTHADEIGLVKAATVNLQTMFKISIEKVFYTCFKHGADRIVCHSGDSVLVAQTTISCVVVGLANDNIPGSCLYEVCELARALLDKGW